MRTTFQDIITEYKETGHLYSIPKKEGTYKVIMPDNFCMNIRSFSDALKSPRKPYEVKDLVKKWNDIISYDESDNNVLYIGKADDLQTRTRQFVRFAIGEANNHSGGRALWQLENNRSLLFEYIVEPNAETHEHQMIEDFMSRHGGTRPFANFTRGNNKKK